MFFFQKFKAVSMVKRLDFDLLPFGRYSTHHEIKNNPLVFCVF
jgi:hypothetical protein